MANRIKKKRNTAGSFQDNAALIMGIFSLIVLCLSPLIYHNFYFDILETKYQFYCAAAIGMSVIMTVYGLASGQVKRFFSEGKIKEVWKSLTVTDWAMLSFWLCNAISWLLCTEWRWEAFWGTSGRYNGAFLMTVYLCVYFFMTRFFHFRQWYLDAFLAVGMLACLFGITDYFQMDILGFKENMVDAQKGIYTSTLGNINTYTIYAGAVLVVSSILFALEKNKKRMLWYYGAMIVSSFALIMGTSDNAYLSLAALFGLAPLYLFRTKTGVRRYLILVATFATVIQCIDWINIANADTVLGIDSAFSLVASMKLLPVFVAALWAAAAAVCFVTRKGRDSHTEEMGRWLIYAWSGLIVAVVMAVVFVFYDANIAGNADRYGAIRGYVVFDEAWGTYRGYVWRCAVDLFCNKLTPLQKVFGYGPDTFQLLIRYYFGGIRLDGQMVLYDSAHNEYLHYLVTIGVAGLASYIMLLGSAIVGMCRKMKGRPELAAVTFAVIAYALQAVVNINIPIATPIIFQLLFMGLSVRGIKSPEKQNE